MFSFCHLLFNQSIVLVYIAIPLSIFTLVKALFDMTSKLQQKVSTVLYAPGGVHNISKLLRNHVVECSMVTILKSWPPWKLRPPGFLKSFHMLKWNPPQWAYEHNIAETLSSAICHPRLTPFSRNAWTSVLYIRTTVFDCFVPVYVMFYLYVGHLTTVSPAFRSWLKVFMFCTTGFVVIS